MDENHSSLKHLQADLARIDILLQHAVRRWQYAGQDAADAFRGLYVSDAEVEQLLHRPFGSNWGQSSRLPEQEESSFDEANRQAALQVQAIHRGQATRLQGLVDAFGLDAFDKDVLLLSLAPALDLRYEKIYGYLQDDVTRKRPGVNLVLDILCAAGFERLPALSHFTADAPLFRHHLLERFSEPGQNKSPLLSQSLLIDETIVHWLLGSYQPSGEAAPYLKLNQAVVDNSHRDDQQHKGYSQDLLKQNALFIYYGPDRLAQQDAMQRLAHQTKQPMLTIDLAEIHGEEISLHQALRAILRDARLTGAIAIIQGWDICLDAGVLHSGLIPELLQHPGMIVAAGKACWRPTGFPHTRPIYWQEFPIPPYADRKALWNQYLREAHLSFPADLTSLSGQFALTSEQIRDAVVLAANRVRENNAGLSEEDLMTVARNISSSQLSGLARKIPARYSWSDIVLPEDQISLLQEIIATVRGRSIVLEEWGLGKKLASSYGVSILFAGPPGTGKTMAAQIMAAELGLDLYKIDLSTIVSKYIGETEKNLEHIFSEAESSNAILFFDEADALFGKRSEVRDSHDRYANVEISYLLQRMEAYDGVTILATNLRSNLDEAFTRRLQFAVDFPFPDEGDRLRIWKALLPPEVPCSPELDLAILAQRYKLAGGNIRNIIVNAAYLASANGGMVTMEHLLHGTRRELQKMGRLVSEDHFGRSTFSE